MRLVMKFGGTSLSEAERMIKSAEIVSSYARNNELVVVCSAAGDVTDKLLEIVEKARRGRAEDVERIHTYLESLHRGLLEAVGDVRVREDVSVFADQLLRELRRAVSGILYLREVTPRSMDYVLSFGEKLSTRIFSGVLSSMGLKTYYLDGGEAGIVTDSSFGEATPLIEATKLNVRRRLLRLLDE
ncbi:MAG: aspartate kinase, partial [Nitrososphaerota archaeon]